MIKIIFSDIDGTLLNAEHAVMPATRQAILDLQDIPFVIVSARSPSGIYPIMKKNGFRCPVIAYSGALILDEDRKIIYQRGMDAALAERILEFIEDRKMPVTWCVYSGDEWIVKDKKDPRIIREEHIVEAESIQGTIQSVPAGQPVHKILCICEPGIVDTLEARIREAFPQVNAVKSSDILLEIMDEAVNKAEAVKLYCAHLGIDRRDAVAFGDNYNDVEMLEAVGYGIVMGNAPEDIRERFTHVTADHNHDGIAKALSRLTDRNE